MLWLSPEILDSLLWSAAGLVAAWVFLPPLFTMLGQTRVTLTVVGGPESVEPTDDDPQYGDLFGRLSALGFEPLGSRVETGWFFNQHWVKSFPVGRILATPERDCFVSLFRLFHGDPWRVAFSTLLNDGSLVQTANQMVKVVIDHQGYFRWGCPSPDLGEVLRQHHLTVEDYRASHGLGFAAPCGMEAICDAMRRHSERYLRSQGLVNGFKHLQTPLVLLVMLLGGWTVYFGYTPWALPIGVILCGVGYQALLPFSVRDASRRLREEDQERGLAYHWAQRRRAAGRNACASALDQDIQRERSRTLPSDAITSSGDPQWDNDRITGDSGPPRR